MDNRLGHRQRLRQRFLVAGIDSFLDYEIVELLLTLGTPRKDCKSQAKELIKKFKTLNNVLEARGEELQKIKGIGSKNIFGIKFFQQLLKRYYQKKIEKKPVLNSVSQVVRFLQQKIAGEKREIFFGLFLDSRQKLLKISEISIGTVDSGIAHPREVFKEAVEVSASQIILTHNHPSGEVEPSEDDLETTKKMIAAGKILGIEVIDHIIVGKDNYFSFKEKNLI
ncbi:MAG: DNA repair protein RadC [Patescibacteria group bacterium]|nr:DNA repair protein RadC [Patescibacteria group bacterium]